MKKIFSYFLMVMFLLPQISIAGEGLNNRLRGRILLQVEQNGEAWYVEPGSGKRAFLGRPEDAFEVMRNFGLGVSEADYNKMVANNYYASAQLAGKIILRVESKGEAYYIHPETRKLFYLGRPADAFRVMREQGLGISNNDLAELPMNEEYDMESVKDRIERFINNNLMTGDSEAEVVSVVLENDMYKFEVKLSNGQTTTSYTDKSITKFSAQAMDIAEIEKQKAANQTNNNVVKTGVSNKKEIPEIELFVMSHCPYGTQIEKGLLPVLELLGDKVNFELKYTDYAMHGWKEVEEQMWQYCIQETGRDELEDYLACFLEEGNRESCIEEVSLDSENLTSCVDDVDQKYGITEDYNDKSTWKGRFPLFAVYQDDTDKYNVGGSPTLVINGDKIQTSRDSNSLLQTICSSFETEPVECGEILSAKAPSPGFGYSNSGSNTDASCGS